MSTPEEQFGAAPRLKSGKEKYYKKYKLFETDFSVFVAFFFIDGAINCLKLNPARRPL